MIRCPSCHRHHRTTESTCPFCGAGGRTLGRKLLASTTACIFPMVLMACYGGAPYPLVRPDTSQPVDSGAGETGLQTADTGPEFPDVDQDGYNELLDCNDLNADIHPDAIEDCADGVDNDCDSLTDMEDDDCAVR